ncbi:MAG: glycogen-binding domain-containing protein [Pontiellaceae bacterium]|nr:glycogen-binding domain-containing protein [Pontiellaceae bacterium]MBN2783767.1 glycogen-binding domain-containing protein [Pontiellaceae bacterium]
MKKHEDLINRLEQHRTRAPAHFAEQVMDALPAWKPARKKSWWARQRSWIVPALAGAAATVVIMLGFQQVKTVDPASPTGSEMVTLHFELFAPGADQVELLGTFNNWKSGDIMLEADESGQWTATVQLPEGRHEYVFLVDGERWIADPRAATFRPDGFGRVNTVIQVYDEDNV